MIGYLSYVIILMPRVTCLISYLHCFWKIYRYRLILCVAARNVVDVMMRVAIIMRPTIVLLVIISSVVMVRGDHDRDDDGDTDADVEPSCHVYCTRHGKSP